MPLTFNTETPDYITFNNQEVWSLIWNGEQVWPVPTGTYKKFDSNTGTVYLRGYVTPGYTAHSGGEIYKNGGTTWIDKALITSVITETPIILPASCASMFLYCSNLASFSGLSNWNTSNVTSMNCMFYGCTSLTSLDLHTWDTSSVSDFAGTFQECTSLTSLNILGFDTSSATAMNAMFSQLSSITELDLSSFNVSMVTNINYMFFNCTNLTTIYVNSNWDSSNFSGASVFNYDTQLVGGNNFQYDQSKISYVYAKINTASVEGYLTEK